MNLYELMTALSHVPDQGVILVTKDYIIEDISDSALQILNQDFCGTIHTNMRETLPALFRSGDLWLGMLKLSCTQYINIQLLPADESGMQLILIQDITKNVMHDVYLRVLNQLKEAVIINDEDGYITHVNDACARIEGLTNQSVVGKHLQQVYGLIEDHEYLAIQAIRKRRRISNVHQVYTVKNGKMMDSLVNAYPIFIDEHLYGSVCITEDYSQIDTLTKKILDLQSLLAHTPKKGVKKSELVANYTFNDIVSRDPKIVNCIKKCKMAAKTDSAVMIYGETGTGKELFAQSIHNQSSRADGPFIAINCAAIPENLLEGMLFGTIKGVYTGAEDRVGLFEQANGGTILLDELNSMPMTLQAKLLRVLQEGRIRRLGDTAERRINVRVISNINRSPHEVLRRGELRQDLFYRLGAVSISIPPLRDRKGDIELLVKNFIIDFNERMQKNVMDVSKETAAIFAQYDWPGNVRELRHAVEHAMNIIPENKVLIRPDYLPDAVRYGREKPQTEHYQFFKSEPAAELPDTKAIVRDRQRLIEFMRTYDGNITRSAAALGLSRQNLQYHLKKHNISDKAI